MAVGSIFVERKFLRGGGIVGHIEDIAVSKSMQGRKLGLHLINALEEIGRNTGCYKIILDCSKENIRASLLSVRSADFEQPFTRSVASRTRSMRWSCTSTSHSSRACRRHAGGQWLPRATQACCSRYINKSFIICPDLHESLQCDWPQTPRYDQYMTGSVRVVDQRRWLPHVGPLELSAGCKSRHPRSL